MDKPWITAELQERHNVFTGTVQALPADVLVRSKNDKWSAAQQLAHILSGVRPVTLSLAVPTWFLRWRFGRLNRAPRSYAELVARYQEKLAAGGRASGRFVPPVIAAEQVPAIAARIDRSVARMCARAQRWSDADLDSVLLPHPLLGKVTVREMLYFTIHHVQHHHALVERDSR